MRRRTRVAAGAAAVGSAGVVAASLLAFAGTSDADPVSLTLQYTCSFPLVGNQPIQIVIGSDIPASIPVGQATPEFAITAVSTVPSTVTQGLVLVGAATVEGTASAQSTVTAPEATLPVTVPTTIPSTPVPATAQPFDVTATGAAPALTFTQAGDATISVGDITLTMTPRKADGTETGLGTFDSACTQNAGQNNVLATFQITGGGETTTTTTGETTTTTSEPTSTTTISEPTSTTTTTSTGGTTTTTTTTTTESSSSESVPSEDTTTTTSDAGGAAPVGSDNSDNSDNGDNSGGSGGSDYGDLAYTGVPVTTPLAIGVLLLGAGSGILLFRRRRPND
ncbi:DUF6801 domain-containing protein [Amycolatopsis acidicola]|uniref:DUF6801 domain-containing protein n=1 Tax=Amycolatopsis acidicola TaxID=2596893 RepID=UPI001AA05667|nr:DUF6801 domain-containing protein [Amycolatopsis acidicola]